MKTSPFEIPADTLITEQEIKKSRFITYLAHTPDVACAKLFLSKIKSEHPSARHHCWAYVAGRPDDPMCLGFSDDGEPSGTAGKPILAQLTGSGVGEITAMVVRYYGGIRLGTGGLVKAYGGGVQAALAQLITKQKQVLVTLTIYCNYSHISLIDNLLLTHDGKRQDTQFGHEVVMTIEIDARQAEPFSAELIQRSRGQISFASFY